MNDVLPQRTVSKLGRTPDPIIITAWPHANRGNPDDTTCVYVGCRVPAHPKLDRRTGKRRLACSRYCYCAHRQMVGAQSQVPYSSRKAQAEAKRRTMTRHRAPTATGRSQKQTRDWLHARINAVEMKLRQAAEKRCEARNSHEYILAARGLMIARMLALQCQDQWAQSATRGLEHTPPPKRTRRSEKAEGGSQSTLQRSTNETGEMDPAVISSALPDFSLIDVVTLKVETKDYRKGWGGYKGRPCKTSIVLHLSMKQTMGVLFETLRRRFDCWEMKVVFTDMTRTLISILPTDTPEALTMYGEERIMVSIRDDIQEPTPGARDGEGQSGAGAGQNGAAANLCDGRNADEASSNKMGDT